MVRLAGPVSATARPVTLPLVVSTLPFTVLLFPQSVTKLLVSAILFSVFCSAFLLTELCYNSICFTAG